MPTKFTKSIVRQMDIDGMTFNVTLDPERGVVFNRKGDKHPQETKVALTLPWALVLGAAEEHEGVLVEDYLGFGGNMSKYGKKPAAAATAAEDSDPADEGFDE